MSGLFRKSLWLAMLALGSATPALAAEVAGIITGPAGNPAGGARVYLEDAFRTAVTGQDGRFLIRNVPAGDYMLVVESVGSATLRQPITVRDGSVQPLTLKLQRNQVLPRIAADYKPPVPERMAEKQAYLRKLATLRPATRPNIIVIFADDLGYGDLSSYGNKLIRTPNLDRLANSGARLTQFYSSSPVCTPSRTGLMTGRYPTRAYAANHVFFPENTPLSTLRQVMRYPNALIGDEIMLSEALQALGYRTGAFGKWHLGTTPGSRPLDRGFDEYYGILYSNDWPALEMYRGNDVVIPKDKLQQGLLTEQYTDEALRFLAATPRNKPFFLYLPHSAPHVPHAANPKTAGRSKGGLYGDVVEDLDHNIGRVLDWLKSSGQADNTIVMFTSDNGGDLGGSVGNLRGRKNETFEGGMRVPFIASWPGRIPAGVVRDSMAMNIDIMPTILSMLSVPAPGDRLLDGRDIMPLMRRGTASPHEYLYYFGWWNADLEAVRDSRWKFRDRAQVPQLNPLFPLSLLPPRQNDPSLYDLALDNESHDLSASHPAEAQRLRAAIQSFRQSLEANRRGWILRPAS